MRGSAAVRSLPWALASLLLPASTEAQFSPGPLSRAHAGLEGSVHCLSCHAHRKQVDPEKCFACHGVLRDRVRRGAGLHSRPDHRDCRTCHIEHQGVEFELVYWGEAGRSSFDHAVTGHALAGRHAELDCESCHREALNRESERLSAEGFTASQSYLGLGTDCASCHADPHRGGPTRLGCDACHAQTAWRPAPGFDHAETGYPLTGRHVRVACQLCHRSDAEDLRRAPVAFTPISSRACGSCHEDVHRGRLGAECETCHSTDGWQSYDGAGFDHDRTRYPLEGRHEGVFCEACHAPGQNHRRPYDRCTSCHADSHRGQLARRADRGACESCHDVFGFEPARFDVADHDHTAYALEGGHLAVPCDACHQQIAATALGDIPDLRLAPGSATDRVTRLRFASTDCDECHRDPHDGAAGRFMGLRGCEACHVVESWSATGPFDHTQTGYPLIGEHRDVPCAGCHARGDSTVPGFAPAAAEAPAERIVFRGVGTECHACHADPHRGQLAREGTAMCSSCHTPSDWTSLLFDHARDSNYALEGAHLRVECGSCHRPQREGDALVVRYKPLPTTCQGCHGSTRLAASGGTP